MLVNSFGRERVTLFYTRLGIKTRSDRIKFYVGSWYSCCGLCLKEVEVVGCRVAWAKLVPVCTQTLAQISTFLGSTVNANFNVKLYVKSSGDPVSTPKAY